jgi:hypothetical protein
MKSSGKALLITAAVLTLGGTAAYLWFDYRKSKSKKKGGVDPSAPQPNGGGADPNPFKVEPAVPPTPVVITPTVPPSLKTDADIRNFQRFAKTKGANLGNTGAGKDGVDGQWGKLSQSAWDMYGNEYLTAISNVSKKLDWNTLKTFLSSDWKGDSKNGWRQNGSKFKTTEDNDGKFQVATSLSTPRVIISFYPNGLMTVEKDKTGGSNTGYSKKNGSWYFKGGFGYVTVGSKEYILRSGGAELWNLLKDNGYVNNDGAFVSFTGSRETEFNF